MISCSFFFVIELLAPFKTLSKSLIEIRRPCEATEVKLFSNVRLQLQSRSNIILHHSVDVKKKSVLSVRKNEA